MVLQNFGRKVSFGIGSNFGGWYPNVVRTLPLIIGVAALATTLLLGSYLWGLVSRRKNKKQEHKSAPLADINPGAGHKPVALTLREFTKAPTSFSTKVADYDNHPYSDESDAEEHYAQVLAEARSHAAATHTKPVSNSPAKEALVETWLARSPDIRRHNFANYAVDDVEAVFAMHQAKIFRSQHKPSKSWKKLLFWKRSKKSNQFELNFQNGAVHSSCTTPMHHMLFHSSKTRATVAPSNREFITPKRSTSGPLYSDGIPYTPNRNSRPFSSPLSGCATPSREGLYESTYKPLKRPYSNYRSCPSPLYIP